MDLDPATLALVSTFVGSAIGAGVAEYRQRRRARAAAAPAEPASEIEPPNSGVHAAPSGTQEALMRAQVKHIFGWTKAESEHRAHDTMARQTILQTAEATQAIAIAVDRLREDALARDRRASEESHAFERRVCAHIDRAVERILREHQASSEALLAEVRLRRS